MEELYQLFHRTNTLLRAEKELQFPLRLGIYGPCGTGKTTLALFIMIQMQHWYERLIIVCPGFHKQQMFRLIDHLVKPTDVYENPKAGTFKAIADDIATVNDYCIKNNKEPLRTLVFVDDLAGLHVLHGGRFGDFAHFAVGCRHMDASLIVISQQPTAVSPAFRDNVNAIICFPTRRSQDIDLLIKEYKGLQMDKDQMKATILKAWKGNVKEEESNEDEISMGKHFLFIALDPRKQAQYFSDFDYSVTPRRVKQ
jgi:hypothetical protein